MDYNYTLNCRTLDEFTKLVDRSGVPPYVKQHLAGLIDENNNAIAYNTRERYKEYLTTLSHCIRYLIADVLHHSEYGSVKDALNEFAKNLEHAAKRASGFADLEELNDTLISSVKKQVGLE